MSTAAERLAEAMADRGVDQATLANAVGVTQGTISLILLGKTRRSKHMYHIASYLGVSPTWLMGMDDVKHPAGPEQVLLGPRERKLIERYRLTNPVDHLTIDNMIDGLALKSAAAAKTVFVLPAPAALARMFEGLLLTLDRAAPVDELASQLAELLPIGLSQLLDLLPETATDPVKVERAAAAAELATNDREPR